MIERLAATPTVFIENAGQWTDGTIRFALNSRGVHAGLTDHGVRFRVLRETQRKEFAVRFVGGRRTAPEGEDRSQQLFHYRRGDAATWRENVPSWQSVVYRGLYAGVDLRLTGRRQGLKYEFVVAPGADWRQVRVRYEGIERLALGEDGTLVLHLGEEWAPIVDTAPVLFQELDGRRVNVPGRYALVDQNTCAFEITGQFDPSRALVIDPEIQWSTYVGGETDDYADAIALDGDGNVLVTGNTFSAGWASGGYDTNYSNSRDAFVTKLSPAGAQLWSTYLGGASEDSGQGVAVDGTGNILVAGSTKSRRWVSGGFNTNYNDNGFQDAFVAKLSPSGTHLWSSYLGGSEWDEGWDVAVDSANNVLVAGNTESRFWISGGTGTQYFGTNYAGGQDGFVVKLDSAGALLWSSYFGGSDWEAGFGVAVDSADNIVLTGQTRSKTWIKGVGATNSTHSGALDAFVVKLNSAGSNLWSLYLGGTQDDTGRRVAVDSADNVLVAGVTVSSNWISGGFDTTYNGGQDGFVTKLSPAGLPLWATYVGGDSDDYLRSVATDGSDNMFLAGSTTSSGWVVGGLDAWIDGFQDGFVMKLGPAGTHAWSSYLGGESSDGATGVAINGTGDIFVSGFTISRGWIAGGFVTNHVGDVDGFVARIRDAQPPSCTNTLPSPLPASPACGSMVSHWGPLLTWSGVSNANGYLVRIFAGPNCQGWPIHISPPLSAEATDYAVPYTLPEEFTLLKDGQAFSWTVQALGDGANDCDSASSSCCSFSIDVTDKSAPTVAITNLAANARITNAVFTLGGTAQDNVAVDWVYYSLNGAEFEPAMGAPFWHAALALVPGTNMVSVYSVDTSGNISAQIDRTFFFVVPSPLTLVTNGVGTIARTFTTNLVEVGRGYVVTAEPGAGWLFSNWSGTITPTGVNPLSFTMQTNMVLQANFVTNHFLALQGTYGGAFFPAEGRAETNSGTFTLNLTTNGTFTGKLFLGGQTLDFAGAFGIDNHALVSVRIPRVIEPLRMNLTLNPAERAIDGQVWAVDVETREAIWVADLRSDRSVILVRRLMAGMGTAELVFDATGHPASKCALEYTTDLATTPVQWQPEPGAVITTNAPGQLKAEVPMPDTTRFYRVRVAP